MDLAPLITWLSDRFEAQQIKASEVAEKARKEAEAEKAALAAARRAKKRARAKAKAKEAAKPANNAAERPRKKYKATEISTNEGVRQKVRQDSAQNPQAELAFQPRPEIPVRSEELKNPQDIGIPKTVVTANPLSLSKESAPEVSELQASSHPQNEKKLKEEKEEKKRENKKKKPPKRSESSSHHQFSASEARDILNAMPRSEGMRTVRNFSSILLRLIERTPTGCFEQHRRKERPWFPRKLSIT